MFKEYFLKGISFGLGFLFIFGILFGLVYAVGFHTASEILPGSFNGNYIFEGTIESKSSSFGSDNIFTINTGKSNSSDQANGLVNFKENNSNRWAIISRNGGSLNNFEIYDYTSNSRALTIINGSGNIGIGQTSPSTLLHIGYGTLSVDAPEGAMTLQSGNGIGGQRSFKLYTSKSDYNFHIKDTGMVNDALSIQYNSGNVGVGVSNPSATFHTKGVDPIKFENPTGNYCIVRVSDTTTCSTGTLLGTNANRALCLICN